jgi:hypothetical protein
MTRAKELLYVMQEQHSARSTDGDGVICLLHAKRQHGRIARGMMFTDLRLIDRFVGQSSTAGFFGLDVREGGILSFAWGSQTDDAQRDTIQQGLSLDHCEPSSSLSGVVQPAEREASRFADAPPKGQQPTHETLGGIEKVTLQKVFLDWMERLRKCRDIAGDSVD